MSKLQFNYGVMNAGKSTGLLLSEYNYRERGMRTLLFTPKIDDRCGGNVVRFSRDSFIFVLNVDIITKMKYSGDDHVKTGM